MHGYESGFEPDGAAIALWLIVVVLVGSLPWERVIGWLWS